MTPFYEQGLKKCFYDIRNTQRYWAKDIRTVKPKTSRTPDIKHFKQYCNTMI